MVSEIIERAEEEYSDGKPDELSLEEFLEYGKENPNCLANSVQYIVNAIEHFGTRTVIERGEEIERYRFFDDPANDGEHAIYGNTGELNAFVDSLKRKAKSDGENDKIVWFTGPTATGKSEFKRCLINGIQSYSRTEEGQRYTLKWSLSDNGPLRSMTYGDDIVNEQRWYKSPVNVNPLAILPEDVRNDYIEEVNQENDSSINYEGELDPFSREAYDLLSEKHDSFSDIVSEEHLKVVSYVPEMGDGIGVIHSEDSGQSKELLVGSWLNDSVQNFVERAGKNPQYFSYEGLLSQGNSLVSILEDIQGRVMILDYLMNVCEEHVVKLDNKITMHVDTLIICISNPDFIAELKEYEASDYFDPKKAIRRRLEKYEFRYLTSLILETQLLLKHVTGDSVFWDDEEPEDMMERVSQPIEKFGTHFSPHAVEAAAYYNVASRIQNNEVDVRKVVKYYDLGYYTDGSEKREIDEPVQTYTQDGISGIPVTYTDRILSELAQKNDIVMPEDVVEATVKNLDTEPVFSDDEKDVVSSMKEDVLFYSYLEMQADVLDSMVGEFDVSKEEIHDYVDSLFSWEEDDNDNYDPYKLRQFEIDYFGASEEEYDGASASTLIHQFRTENIIQPISSYIYDNKDEYDPQDIPIEESHTIETLLKDESWERVEQLYPNLDLDMWQNPPENSETEEVKEKTIRNMKEKGYNEESAERATVKIISLREEILEWA